MLRTSTGHVYLEKQSIFQTVFSILLADSKEGCPALGAMSSMTSLPPVRLKPCYHNGYLSSVAASSAVSLPPLNLLLPS